MQKFYNKNFGVKGFTKSVKTFAVLFFTTLLSVKTVANVYVPTTFTDPAFTAINNATGVITAGAGIGFISLRSALTAADNLGGTHTITLSTGTYNLTQAIPNRQITIGNTAQNITINGNGPANTIINNTLDANQDRILFINPTGATNSPVITVNGIRFQNAFLSSDPFGGAAICAGGGSAESLTVTNCTFDNNVIPANGFGGAAICMQVRGDLTVDNCTFTNNVSNDADGGAILFIIFGSGLGTGFGTLSVTNSTFTSNSVVFPGAPTSNGGALAFTGQAGVTPFNATINNNTFITNTADGLGGAISANNSPNLTIPQIHFNRFFNNTSAASATSSGLHFVESSGSVNAENNWWGCNTNPVSGSSTSPCNQAGGDVAGGGALDANPWLQLRTTASPNPICNTPAGLGNTTTVTTSFLNNSDGTAIPVANLTRLIGLPVTWGPTTLGSLSAQQLSIQASGNATATFTSNGTGGTATVNTQVDNVPAAEVSPARASITVNTLPTVTNPVNITACAGGTAIFTSTITGTPAPTIVWRIGATALVNGLQVSGSTVSGQGTNTLTITNVQPGDAAVNYNVQANNTCGTATSTDATLAVNVVTGGTVGSDQTICSGGDPALFTESVASTGSGALTYQWQSSTTSCAAGFSNIGGATGTTYDAPSGLAITTFYRRVTTSTLNAVPCTANSNCITVTINNVTGGTVAADQTICSGGDPAAFTQTVASTGTALTYQWQSSTTSCAAGFSNIGGATAITYDPPAGLLVTTYYRRVTTSTLNAVLCTANSNCITVSVNDVTGGTVGSDQTICSGGDPAAFTQIVASTGSGALTYQWQSSTTSCAAGFSNIGGATATTYDPPAGLLVTTYYRRVTTSTLNAVPCTANSNCITVTINNVTGGTVAADQTICSGGDPAAFTETVASTGSGALTYQWQSSTTSCAAGFSNIGGATGTTYDPPAGLLVTTYYRRVTTSTFNAVLCTANSNCITVTVNNVTGGTVGSDQAICPGGDPAAFTETVTSTGGGALTYQWQSSTTSCAAGFSNIGGATATTYDAPAGLAVTTYYRRVTTSTLNAVLCTANSNCITVTVNPTNTITLTSAPGTDAQTVLVNTPIINITYATTGATGATFSGLPAGVTGNWAANVVTISGSPTTIVGSPFNYTVTLTGGCGLITATGTITVFNCSITLTSAPGTNAQTVCNNSPITNITYSTTGATGATFSGLPTGVTGNWAANVVTISGTATVTGTFNYTVTLTGGGCGAFNATGTITVDPVPDVNQPADQVVCNNGATLPVNFTGSVVGTVFNWINTDPSIGLAASGTGNIASFTATNVTNAPVVATVTVTPQTGGPVTFTNTAAITIPSGAPVTTSGPATPYPSNIVVSGVSGTVTAVTVKLNNFNHTFPDDVDVLLVGPGGQNAIILSDVGGSLDAVGVTLTLDDAAATNLPDATQLVTGTFKPTNIGAGDAFAAPAPAPAGGSLLSVFNGTAPNGTWSLYVMDDLGGDVGNFNGGWEITITSGTICTGTAKTFTYTVNPTPNAVATPASQTSCSGSAITTIALTGNVAGTVYNWTRDNSATVTGIAASGSGNISGTLTNTTFAPVTVTFTITPSFTNGGVTCTGTPITATVVVNPTPDAVATPSSQTICSGSAITTIALTGNVAGTVYNWTRNNTVAVTGIAASGSGNISGALTNTTFAPVTVTFTITPTANGCPGAPITATVLVNPTPNAVATPASQTICSDAAITTIVLTSAVAGTTFNWTRNNTVTVTGIAASGSGNISGVLTNTTNAPITVTFTITPTANGCPGAPITATVLVNPTPNAVATPASQTVCSANPITTIVLTSAVAGTTYNWTRDNTVTVTGIAASGSGNISGTLTNTTFAPVTVTFTITPTANGCPGAPITATVLVNPTPNAVATPASQTICSGNPIFTIVLTSAVAGTTYNWTRNNTVTVTGIAASGAGNISGSLTNTTTAPITVTFTITPTANGCPGAPITATVLVNPTPNAVATPASQTICSGATITTIVLTGAVAGTTYDWTRDNNATVSGIPASGSGNISGSLTNITNAPVTVTFTITPTANGCPGAPITATVVVNPTPDAVAAPPSQTICSGSTITTIVLNGNVSGTTFNWTRNNTVAVTGIAASGSGNISGALTNTTNAPVTVTFTIIPTANGCPGPAITATVLVNPTPNAVATPASQTICSGATITTIVLSGAVAGTTFAWTRNNTVTVTGIAASGSGNISGSLTNTTIAPITVTFTITPTANGCPGAAITATVVVNPTPTITCPANITVNAAAGTCGADVIYPPATATGVPAPTVTYSIPSGSNFPVGVTTVTATATNICGTVTCTFTITVIDVRVPLITTQPVNRTVCVGSSATFSVVATNVTSYQWQVLNGVVWNNIAGATASSFTINPTTLSMNNNNYRVALTGPCGTVVFSNVVTLVVNPLPLVTLSSASNPIMLPGTTLTITANVNPAGGTFVWLFNGTVMTGVTGSSLGPLTVLNVGTYTVIYTDPNGCVSTSLPFVISAGVTDYLWVYPNPNTGQFNVRFYNITGETATLKIFNYLGQVVYTQTMVLGVAYSNFLIDMRRHAAGVYTVKIMNGSGALMAAKRLLIYHP